MGRITPLVGGACQENFAVEVDLGDRSERVVVRGDSAQSLPGSIRRAAEFEVVRAACEAGVETPRAHALFRDALGAGRDAYVMDWADGTALGSKVVRDPALADARGRLVDALARNLARLHGVRPGALAFEPPWGSNRDAVAAALASTEEMMRRLPSKRPAAAAALRWLELHRPAAGDTVLVHGDYRTGNFLVTPSGLGAVLDWEFAHWGAREEDVAWACVRDWRFGALRLHAFGLCDRRTWWAAYEAHSGVAVDPEVAHWWEVFGNMRWALGAACQAERCLSGAVRDIELLAVGRRVPELEYEALRLIEEGPT